MKTNSFLLCVLLFLISACSQHQKVQQFYVGTYASEKEEGIYLCSLNLETGEINLEKSFSGIENPSFLKLSSNRKFLYSVSQGDEKNSFVYSYKLDKNKNIHLLNKQSSNGASPCHLDISNDGKYLAVANYAGGTTSLLHINKDGSLNASESTIQNKGFGPNKKRQNQPHAHSIKFSSSQKHLFSADLGTDNLNIYKLEEGKMVNGKQPFIKMLPGAGPRHFIFHPHEEIIYVINELNSTIAVIRKENNQWELIQNISTLPEKFEGENYCADIHISENGKYLYGSNRGDNSISVFGINAKNQKLTYLESVETKGNWPRNFGITPNGQWLLVANQKSGNITVFKINKQTGIPVFTGKQLKIPAPVCIEFL